MTYYLPVDTQFEVFRAVVPGLKSVLLLLEKGHPGAVVDREGTRAVCSTLGIRYSEAEATTLQEAVGVVQQNAGKGACSPFASTCKAGAERGGC